MNRLRSIAIAMALPAVALGSQPTPAPESSSLCWRSLSPDTGPQELAWAVAEPTLAASGPDEAWLGWEEGDPRIFRWAMGKWLPISVPERPGAQDMRHPVIAATASGEAVVALSANGKDGTAAIHVARVTGDSWQWLGTPLLSSQESVTHANEASIAIGDGGRPVVAWSEERNVRLLGLFVAQWDGAAWKRLGVLRPQGSSYDLSPRVVVDSNKTIWLSWLEDDGRFRVSRWSGSAWNDVGGPSLAGLTATKASAFRPSFVVDGRGRAWLLWVASQDREKYSLALVRWDGQRWSAVPPPRVAQGLEGSVGSATLLLRGDAPVVAWSQADETENKRLFVARWGEGNAWTMLLAGLHLAEGFSDVNDVSLAAADEGSFFVSWDEGGKDERRTRLVQAYSCAVGEKPAVSSQSVVERETWPTTVDEAARRLVDELGDEGKDRIRTTKEADLIQFHHGWGTGIRNSFGLWRGNQKLLDSCGGGKRIHPDDCSMIIIKAVWKLLQQSPG